jgi:hypothetical protein
MKDTEWLVVKRVKAYRLAGGIYLANRTAGSNDGTIKQRNK